MFGHHSTNEKRREEIKGKKRRFCAIHQSIWNKGAQFCLKAYWDKVEIEREGVICKEEFL